VTVPGSAKELPPGVVVPAGAAGLRLAFTLASQKVELSEAQARQVAPSWTTKDTQIFSPEATAGAWVEARDASGALSFQQNLFDPLGRRVEGPPNPSTGGGWTNGEVCRATAQFSVEVPGDAAEVRVYGSEHASGPTVLLAWYRLR
jgi:hypothetical protein